MIFQTVKEENFIARNPSLISRSALIKKHLILCRKIASEKGITSSSVVNQLLRSNMKHFLNSDGSIRQTFQEDKTNYSE
jgi:hypothetical protein